MNILVTGATGFIGRHLLESLIKDNHRIFALVRKTSKVDSLLRDPIDLIYGDISDEQSLAHIGDYAIDAVFHCAALVREKPRKKLYLTNVTGTGNICKLCLTLKVKRLVYVSSVAVVSGNPQVPLTEDAPYCATNLYGASKIDAEKLVIEYRRKGLAAAILRPPVVYGENEPHALSKMLYLLRLGALPLVKRGEVRWHLAYVKNVVDALKLALEEEKFLKGTFFVADEDILTVKEIFLTLAEAIDGPRPFSLPLWASLFLTRVPVIGNKVKFFLKDRVFDISKIKSAGFVPQFRAKESLIKSARQWLENQKSLRL